MTRRLSLFLYYLLLTTLCVFSEILLFLRGVLRSRASVAAENLFLRKQLAFYQERHVRPHRLTNSARLSLLLWSRCFDWKNALVVVQPERFIGWHRSAFQLFCRWPAPSGNAAAP